MKNHFGIEEIDLKHVERDVVTKYLSVSIKGFESVTCTFIFSIFRITFLASTSEGSYSVITH